MRRPTIHRSTVVVGLGILALLLLMNVPGELTSYGGYASSATAFFHSGANYEHGWPWVFLYRSFDYPSAIGDPKYGVPWLAWSNWEFWHFDTWKFRFGAFVLNLVTGSLLIVAIAGAWEWRRRRRRSVLQVRLVEFFAIFAVVAAPLGWWWHAKEVVAREAAAEAALGEAGQCIQDYYGPLWLKRLMGEGFASEIFSRVDTVTLDGVDGDKFEHAMPSLRAFSCLKEMEFVVDPDAKTPIQFSRLAELPRVRSLVLDEIVLTRQDVEEELALVPQLKRIAIENWRGQDPAIIQRLMGALPNCTISEDRIFRASDDSE